MPPIVVTITDEVIKTMSPTTMSPTTMSPTTMSPTKAAGRRWEGEAELAKNIEAMEDAAAGIRPEESATIKDVVEWALASPWTPFDPAKFPYLSSPLPLAENEPIDQLLSFDGVFECRDEVRGRYLAASRDLIPGETLIVEKPFASIIHVNHGQVVCCFCKKHPLPTDERIVCESCESAAWCSEKCRESSRLFHGFECAFLQCKDKKWMTKSRLFRLASRMILKGWKNVLDVFLAEHLKIQRRSPDSFKRSEFDLVVNESSIFKMTSDSRNLANWELRSAARYALWSKTYLYLLKSAGFVKQLESFVAPFLHQASGDGPTLHSELDQFLGETILRHVIRLKCNHFESWHSPVGVSLYLTIAQINHSCRPNCSNFFRGDTHYLRVAKPIKMGEELFIVYDRAATNLPERQKRKRYLASQFGFECLCTACNEGDDLEALYAKEDSQRGEEEEEKRCRVLEEIEKCKRLTKGNLHERAEKAIYETFSLAAAAEMWRSAAELDELLNQVQCQADRERIYNNWID